MTSRTSIPTHVHPIVSDLFRLIKGSQLTQNQIEEKAGLSRGQISHWRCEDMPRIDTIDACFNVLGHTLRAVPNGATIYLSGGLSGVPYDIDKNTKPSREAWEK